MVFGAGFCLAFIRIPFLEPRLGARWAELIEAPAMLAVIVWASRGMVRRFAVAPAAAPRLVMGLVALACMLAAEFGLVLALRGMTIEQYFATRDPVSGTVYYLMLLVFALLPYLEGRRTSLRR
jgi:hypothetical protein